MTSPYIILLALLTRILSQIKFIVCVAAFPLPKKFRVQPSFFGSPFYINIICVVCSYVRDIEVADCRWQSFCDLTESADESRPLQGFAYITFGCRGRRPRRPKYANVYCKITRSNCGRHRTSHGRSRTPAPTTKRDGYHNPVGDGVPNVPNMRN